MSLDDEIRVYERALLRSGQDPKAVALRLLQGDEPRFLLLSENPYTFGVVEPMRVTCSFVYETNPALGHGQSRRLWALPVTTVEQFVEWSGLMKSHSCQFCLWDRANRKNVTVLYVNRGIDWIFDAVREGWDVPDQITVLTPQPHLPLPGVYLTHYPLAVGPEVRPPAEPGSEGGSVRDVDE